MLFDNEYKKAVEAGQDLLDIAIQEYGSAQMALLVLNDNANVLQSLTGDLPSALVLKFRKQIDVPKPEVRNWFTTQEKDVNTHNSEVPPNYLLQENNDLILQETGDGILITLNTINAQSQNIGTASNNSNATT